MGLALQAKLKAVGSISVPRSCLVFGLVITNNAEDGVQVLIEELILVTRIF